jgi:crotonobetaine/carnitine-CoA ligase
MTSPEPRFDARQSDPRVPPPEVCVLRPLLERRASETPDKIFAKFSDGGFWTYGTMRDVAVKTAAALQSLGVRQGDHVLSWLPNGRNALRIWFGLNYIGAVYVPINLAYKGSLLQHVVRNSDARLMVAHGDLVGRLADIDRSRLETVVALDGAPGALDDVTLLGAEALDREDLELKPLDRPIEPWDTQSIIYTSGTTGPSKGVLSSYCHLYTMAGESFYFLDSDDRYMIVLPLFHVGGTLAVFAMLARGGSIAVVEAFDTKSIWPLVRATETTVLVLLGVMAHFLSKQPAGPEDRQHPVRKVIMVPVQDAVAFSERFGVDVYTVFNMTEISSPIISGRNPPTDGSCGRKRAGVDVRLVDENDVEVEIDAVGELVVRTDRPWAMNHGYYKDPEATARAWRNGWFHTGDAFRVDGQGNYFFVDRLKDVIRRRGENISSFEVETEVCTHPAVREAAAVAVPSEVSEDDLLVAISLAEGQSLDPLELINYLIPRMAYFSVPRYVRILPHLPKTPTQKILKHVLRREGVTADTWDREKAGVRLRRERLGPRDASGA